MSTTRNAEIHAQRLTEYSIKLFINSRKASSQPPKTQTSGFVISNREWARATLHVWVGILERALGSNGTQAETQLTEVCSSPSMQPSSRPVNQSRSVVYYLW